MAYDIGPVIGIEGESEFRNAIKGITDNMRTLGTEMKVVASQFDKNDNSEEAYAARSQVLNKQIEEQKNKLDELKKGLQSANEKYGESDKVTQGWQRAVNQATADLNNLDKEVKANKTAMENAKNPTSEMSKEVKNVGDNAENAGKKTGIFGDVLKANLLSGAIMSGIKSLASEMKNLITDGIGFNSTMEQYNTSFEVMTGSAEEARKVTANLKEVAAKTPFEIKDLADTTQLLMNYGFTADEAINRMNMLGDISQGNADKMNRISTAYGQMSSAGKVSLEDVKQMIEAGFNPLQEISTTTGESMASLYDRISHGTISVNEITESMQRSTSEGGKYFGSMEKQSKTLNGQMSTLKDTINGKLGDAMTNISGKLTDEVIPAVTDFINNLNTQGIADGIANVAETVMGFGKFLIDNKDIIIPAVVGIGVGLLTWNVASMINGVVTGIKAFKLANEGATIAQALLNGVMNANPIMLVVTLIAGLVAAIVYLWNTNEDFRNGVKEIGSDIANFVSGVVNAIGYFFTQTIPNAANSAKDGIVNGFNGAIDFITGIPSAIGNILGGLGSSALNWGKDLISGLIDGIMSGVGAVGDAAKSVASRITSFLHFSVPDEGPLTEYESWMPDFMSGLANGINKNKQLVTNAISGLSTDMALNTNISLNTSTSSNKSQLAVASGQTINVELALQLPGGKEYYRATATELNEILQELLR